MRVLFVDPPSPPGSVAFRHSHAGLGELCPESRLRVPTLDVFHAAAWALRAGAQARVLDCVVSGAGPAELAAAARAWRPDLLAVRTAAGSLACDLACGLEAKKASGAALTFFGPQAGLAPERLLAAGADAVAVGEAPAVFGDIAARGRLVDVPGLALPGRGLPTPRLIEDVDRLPVPRWDLVDRRRYSYVTTQTAWGCPLSCGYCPYPVVQGRRLRARSAASVVAEFRQLRRWRVPFVLCRDPYFTADRRRASALCAALEAAGTPVLWGCETRLESLDEDLVGALARAGCVRVMFGVESLDAAVLRGVGRAPMRPARIRAKVALLKRHGMLTYALYLLGLPGETEQSARATIDFALSLGTEAASFSCATPLPGTALAETARRRGLAARPAPRLLSTAFPSLSSGPLPAAEVGRLREEAKARWRASRRPRSASRPCVPA